MKIQQKPDYLIFAEGSKSGELSDFPDISRGWGITLEQTQAKPPLEWMNSAFNRIDKNTLYLLQQGVPEWSESVLYPIGAIIKVGGTLYEAKTQNTNLNPINSPNDWQLVVRFQDATTKQKGIVQLSSETDSESETQAATSLAVKKAYDKANNALPITGGTVTGETDFTGGLKNNGNDVLDSTSITLGFSQSSYTSIRVFGKRMIIEGGSSSNNFDSNGMYDFTLPSAFSSSSFTFIATDTGEARIVFSASPQSGGVVRVWGKFPDNTVITGNHYFKFIAVGVI